MTVSRDSSLASYTCLLSSLTASHDTIHGVIPAMYAMGLFGSGTTTLLPTLSHNNRLPEEAEIQLSVQCHVTVWKGEETWEGDEGVTVWGGGYRGRHNNIIPGRPLRDPEKVAIESCVGSTNA